MRRVYDQLNSKERTKGNGRQVNPTLPTSHTNITLPNKGEIIMLSDTDLPSYVKRGADPPRHASICLQVWKTK
ncbi:unnamed protein product [Musa hybrid cultivar]